MELRFLTKNKFKAAEFSKLFEATCYRIVPDGTQINEIQTEDMNELVTDKVLKAFNEIRRPVFVDHTGLYFELLNGFPGGLTEIFWNRVQNVGIACLVGNSARRKVIAKTLIGYCDGKAVRIFEGKVEGTVPAEPRGPGDFQWDAVFIPEGYSETFAEMGARKNGISMRRKAVDCFIDYLNSEVVKNV